MSRLGRGMRRAFLNISLRCLLDIQVEISGRKSVINLDFRREDQSGDINLSAFSVYIVLKP